MKFFQNNKTMQVYIQILFVNFLGTKDKMTKFNFVFIIIPFYLICSLCGYIIRTLGLVTEIKVYL